MKDYFDAEMRLLNEAATDFARSYPEQAGMLNLSEIRDRDPYIERLLEGMAYLTAHIRSRIDDDIPEISRTLIHQMWPQFIRPFPSATIIQFHSKINQLSVSEVCYKSTKVLSDSVGEEENEARNVKEEKVRCEYRTVNKVILNPISIVKAQLNESVTGGAIIRLDFEIGANAELENLDIKSVPLYLHGYPTLTLDLWYFLTQHLSQVKIKLSGSHGEEIRTIGGQEVITPGKMDSDSLMLPKSGRSFTGTHLLHEYFCFREKFLFLDLNGLNRVKWPEGCHRFSLEFTLDSQFPSDYQIDEETFRLHCTPAINLFESDTEPVLVDHRRSEYRVLSHVERPNSEFIYSFESIESVGRTSGQRHNYYSIHRLNNSAETPRHYHVAFRKRPNDGEEAVMSLGGVSRFESETLSCTTLAYNGHYPRRYLFEGSIRNDASNNNALNDAISLFNVTRPTPTYMPPNKVEYHWGLVAHLSLNYSSIADLDTLKRLLELYEWTGRRENQRKIDGIKSVDLELYQEMYQGALIRGMEVVLTLHEGNYVSMADISLFTRVLHSFFTMYANINTVVRTKVHCHPSGKELTWRPALGETSLM
jgi:type VI secretion system protein ImpG